MSDSENTLYCANHPTITTGLRCNNCDKPICVQCAVLTPTGYRCKECIRSQQRKFDTAEWYDYILAFFVGAAIAFAGSLVVRFFGFLFFLVFIVLGAFAGFLVAEAIRWVTRRRRSKRLFQLAAASVIVGCLPVVFWDLLTLNFMNLLWVGIYAVSTASAVYARLRGLRM
jgi:hypothetical protein